MQYPLIPRSKMEDAPNINQKKPQSGIPRYLDTSTEAQMANIMVQYGRPSRSFRKDLYGHPPAGLLWEKQFEKVLLEHGWEKVFKLGMFICQPSKRTIPISVVDDIKLAGKTENIEPTWKILMEDVDLGEPTSFLDHVNLGCTQTECKISDDIVASNRDMLESRISAGAKEKLPTRETISSLSCDMEGHAKKCVEIYCELAKKTTQQLYKVATPCMDDPLFKKEEENESVGEFSTGSAHKLF